MLSISLGFDGAVYTDDNSNSMHPVVAFLNELPKDIREANGMLQNRILQIEVTATEYSEKYKASNDFVKFNKNYSKIQKNFIIDNDKENIFLIVRKFKTFAHQIIVFFLPLFVLLFNL